jgi:hypothetical protein
MTKMSDNTSLSDHPDVPLPLPTFYRGAARTGTTPCGQAKRFRSCRPPPDGVSARSVEV